MFLQQHLMWQSCHGVDETFLSWHLNKPEHDHFPKASEGLQWLLSGLLDGGEWSRCATPQRGPVSPPLQSLLPDAGQLSLTIALHGCHVLLRPAGNRTLQAHPGQVQNRKSKKRLSCHLPCAGSNVANSWLLRLFLAVCSASNLAVRLCRQGCQARFECLLTGHLQSGQTAPFIASC